MNMKKEVPAYVLFIIAVISYGLNYLIGGVIGAGFGMFGLMCLVLSIVRFFREQADKRKIKAKSPLKKFEAIKASVKSHTKSLMSDNYEEMDSRAAAAKAIFRTIDKEQRQKMGDEQKNKLDELDEIKHVLDILEEEVNNGHISPSELQEIKNSKEFKDYNAVNF